MLCVYIARPHLCFSYKYRNESLRKGTQSSTSKHSLLSSPLYGCISASVSARVLLVSGVSSVHDQWWDWEAQYFQRPIREPPARPRDACLHACPGEGRDGLAALFRQHCWWGWLRPGPALLCTCVQLFMLNGLEVVWIILEKTSYFSSSSAKNLSTSDRIPVKPIISFIGDLP